MEPIKLGEALDAVVAALTAKFPVVHSVVAEDESHTDLRLPAIIVQISEIEPTPDADQHEGQFPCNVHFEARIILGHRTPKVRRLICEGSAGVAAFVHNNRMGVPWGAGVVLACEPDEFAPQVDKFDVWRVEWVHAANVGPFLALPDEFQPTQVFLSRAPEIGVPHESDYVEVSKNE